MKTIITELWINGNLITQCGQPFNDFDLNDVLVIIKETDYGKEDSVVAIK